MVVTFDALLTWWRRHAQEKKRKEETFTFLLCVSEKNKMETDRRKKSGKQKSHLFTQTRAHVCVFVLLSRTFLGFVAQSPFLKKLNN